MAANDQPESRKLPRWTTAWPEWFGIFGNVCVVPAEDYDRLLASIKSNLPSGMAEMVIESAGLPSSGSAAQAGEKSGTAPTAAVPAVTRSTWRRDAIEWATETIENGYSSSIGEATAEALAQTILAYSASSESTATEKGSAAEALALFEWAESNPEAARSCIDALWAQCGRGGREEFFNYRKCIRDAMRLGERPRDA